MKKPGEMAHRGPTVVRGTRGELLGVQCGQILDPHSLQPGAHILLRADRGIEGHGIAEGFRRRGKVGQAFDFNGSTFMKAPQAGAGLSAFSISSWVYFDNRTNWGTIVKNWGDAVTGAYHLGLAASQFRVSNFLGTNAGVSSVESGNLSADTWYHVAVTLGPSLTQKLYVNGVQVGSGSASGTLNNNYANMSMGGKLNDAQNAIAPSNPGWLDGYLDELAFFNQELTSSDILGIYNAGLAGQSVTTLGYAFEPYVDPTAAVPEPGQVAASLLLLGGIGGYVFLKRRKTAKAAQASA
ncbi:MAG: hypothetical protein KGR46_09930 [Verrucomicrobia bacterium]|nr:hypothetical protein [Verrucomicrobiota bacterium]